MLKFLFLLALAPLPTFASASSEIRGSSNVSVTARTDTEVDSGTTSSATTFSLDLSYGFFLSPYFEPQFDLYAYTISGSSSNYQITPRAGAAFNFSEETQSSFYLGGRAGPAFVTVSGNHNYTLLDFDVFVGKRFSLVEHVCWAPEISFNGHTNGETTVNGQRWTYSSRTNWTFTPFQIAVLF